MKYLQTFTYSPDDNTTYKIVMLCANDGFARSIDRATLSMDP